VQLRLLALEERTQPAGLLDPGFELPVVGLGAFRYTPGGSPWAFGGPAGVAANGSGFTSGNPGAPEGGQVAFLQQLGAVSQVTTLAAGTYAISFSAAQRGNLSSAQTFRVMVDGQVVGTFNSVAGTGYTTLTTSTFTVATGAHTIAFQATNINGGDNTIFLDAVGVVAQGTGLTDSGFEMPSVGLGAFRYNPAGSPWGFAGPAGVAANGSGFTSGNPGAPEGGQVAFLQGLGSASQAVALTAGTYTVSFTAAQRGNLASAQTFRVMVDGQVVGTFNSVAGTAYTPLTTSSFTVATGAHALTFQGTNINGGDNTILIDAVGVGLQTTSLSDSGFEMPSVGLGAFLYRPAGSPWGFAGPAGVAANGSGFTAGNPGAPQGGQVLFVQQLGAAAQAAVFGTGTYALSFSAAQRGNLASAQTFRVMVDGQIVGTFNNLAGTAYTRLATTAFTLVAGVHTVTFQGTNINGGDNTVLIDAVSVNTV
jgi:hypothetical protein